jgi:hypothetical protein
MLTPNKVTNNGNSLKLNAINSISTNKLLIGSVKRLEDQKSVPNPIKSSFVKNPIKILKSDNTNKGKVIFILPSCAFSNGTR